MKSPLSFMLLVFLSFWSSFSLTAQHFSSGATVTDGNLSGREWHITSKIDGNPAVGEWFGGAAAVADQPLDFHRTFIIEDGPDDGDGWTPDVRWFHIRNRYNNQYLTVLNASSGSATGWADYNGTQGDGMWSQQFRLIGTEIGWYKLRSRLSQSGPDLVLSIAPNGQLIAETPNAGASPEQKFALNLAIPSDPSARYVIVGVNNNDLISDQGLSPENSEVVHVEGIDYSCYWQFLDAGDGYFYIQNSLTGNYLSNNGSTTAGDQLYMNKNTSENAKWSFVRNEHTFRLENKVSGYQIGTKGQTANKKPLYQEVNSGIGVKWLVLPITQEDPPFLEGDYQRLLDGAGPYSDCMLWGINFQKAVCERAGLPADEAWFPVVLKALEVYYQDTTTALQAMQNVDLNNTGHRTELAFAMRNYVIIDLALKQPQDRTQQENELVTMFETKIRDLRWAYTDELFAAAQEFETSFGINNGGPVLFSDLLDLLDADDFIWPGDYEASSARQLLMEEYSSACKTLDFENDHQRMGINIAMTIEPVVAPGVAVALNMGIRTGVTALAPAIDFTLAPNIVQAAQASIRSTAALASNAGNIITVALIACQIIAQEAMEAVEVNRLGQRIIDRIIWGRREVSMYNTLTGPDELAKLRLLGDMDYIVGAPVDGFQFNDNDNWLIVPFYLTCYDTVRVDLDENGLATLNELQVADPIAHVCGGPIEFTLSESQFDCNDLGNRQITMEAKNTGLTSTCTINVVVRDNTAPVVLCKNATIYLGATGIAGLTYPDVLQSATDNCGVAIPQGISQTVFGCSHLGANNVTVNTTDDHGNSTTCLSTVTVVDALAPNVTCKPKTVYLDANGAGSIATADVFQSGADNCGVVNQVSVFPNTFDCSKIGANTSTLTVNDGHGNQATCQSTVTVVDAVAPSVACQNFAVNLDANGSASIQTNNIFLSGSDNCGVVNQQAVSPNTFSCSMLGANIVTLTVHDGHGNTNTCTATVTVSDAILPTMLCKNTTLSLDNNGVATLSISQVNNGSFDNCSIASMELSKTTFGCANLGVNQVTLMGRDQSANRAECSATVTVLDGIAPVARCKNLTANLGTNGTVTILPISVDNGSTDNCSFTQTLAPNTFSCSQVGLNTVTLRATDGSGNSSNCTAVVTVRDQNGPTALCKNSTIFLDAEGQATLSVAQINNGSSDACGISTMTLSKTQFNCADLPGSSQTVTLLVKDVNNNSSSCTAQVAIRDYLLPTAVCASTTVQLGYNGTVIVYPSELASESYDNCSVWSYSPVNKLYTSANLGNNNLTITVKDYSGNSATCVSVVTVIPNNGSNNLQQPVKGSENGLAGTFDLALYPNPSNGEANLVFELPNEQMFLIRVFDLSGRMVFSQAGSGVANENTLPIRLAGIAPGTYLLDFESGGLKGQKRVVILE